MKANLFNVLFITIVICTVLVCDIFGQGKDLSIEYYPKTYNTLSSNNWQEIKENLDKFLHFKNIDTIERIENPSEASFLLSRIAFIDWNSDQKKEVISFLINFADSILQGKSFIKDFSNIDISEPISINNPKNLPHRAIWTMIQLDEKSACKYINELFVNNFTVQQNQYIVHIRQLIIWSLTQKFKSDRINNLLKQIQKITNIAYTRIEKDQISKSLIKYEIFKINNQEKAWEFLWSNSKIESNIDIFDKNNQIIWYKNILYMIDVYNNLNISMLLDISDRSSNLTKQYFMLYTSCFLLNKELTSLKKTYDGIIINRTIDAVDFMYKSKFKENLKVKDSVDFLYNTFELMKENSEKWSR